MSGTKAREPEKDARAAGLDRQIKLLEDRRATQEVGRAAGHRK